MAKRIFIGFLIYCGLMLFMVNSANAQLTSCGTPTNFTLGTVGITNVQLNWDVVTGASYYEVKLTQAGSTLVRTYSSAQNSLYITLLNPTTQYSCTVNAVCNPNKVTSALSAILSFTTLSNTACGVPQNVTLSNQTASGIKISWNAVAGAQSYRISISGGTNPSTGLPNPTYTYSTSNLFYQLNNLSANTTYTYSVAAVCGGIPGSASATGMIITPTVVCSAVTSTSVLNITYNSARVQWTATTSANSYKIEYQVAGASTFSTINTSANYVNLYNLLPNTTYNYKVTPICAGVAGTASTLGTFPTAAPPSCPAPANISVSNVTTSSANLSWTSVAFINNYKITLQKAGTTVTSTYTAYSPTYTLQQLTPNTTYTYTIATICSGFVGAASTPATFTTTSLAACNPPTNLATTAITASSVSLSWAAVSGASYYRITRTGGNPSTTYSYTTSLLTYNISGLNANTTYSFSVGSVCNGLAGAMSSPITATTLAAAPCSTPTNVTATGIDVQKATISWTPVAGVPFYRVQLQAGNGIINTYSTNSSFYNFTSLLPNTTYTYSVASACTSTNLSAYSTAQTFTTLAAGVCPTPTNVTVSNIGAFGATITWDSLPGVSYWKVQVTPTGVASTSFFSSIKKTYVVSNLIPSTAYTVNVTASCASNVSSGTSTATFSTTVATVCPDLNEPNNVTVNATPLTVGVTATGAIDVSTDIDYFSFSNTAAEPHLKVTLFNLPKDYDLKLYNAAGVQVGSSLAGSTNNDVIKIANAPVGTYYAKVYGFSTNATPFACYSIKAEIANIPFTLAPPNNGNNSFNANDNVLEFKVFPNPIRDEATIDFNEKVQGTIRVGIMDMTGRLVKNYNWNVSANESRFNIDLSDLQNGLYMMNFNNGIEQKTAKIVVNK